MKKKTCYWEFDEFWNAWKTSCGWKKLNMEKESDGPIFGIFQYDFCPFCGKILQVSDEMKKERILLRKKYEDDE